VQTNTELAGSRWKIRNVLIAVGDVVGVLVLIALIAIMSHGLPMELFNR
jgi:hypothetical protein